MPDTTSVTTRSITIIGDSHIQAIKKALLDRTNAGAKPRISALRLTGKKQGDLTFDEAVAFAAQRGPEDILAVIRRGNFYNTLALIQHPQAFDLLEPGADAADLQEGAELVPHAVMKDFFTSTIQSGYVKMHRRLREASPAPVICLEVPPPKEDAEHIRRSAETFFVQNNIAEAGVTPAPIRLKLWKLQQSALAASCHELGIDYLPSPAGTRNERGFLRPEFYAPDATHANAAYGELVLRQLEAISRTPNAGLATVQEAIR
ncbi:hypothetical protein [Rubellimicrobium aerolatum]|uniref:SGNH/GDSL hydrolase family protein n=1 Tax=Rubellimicrobium aerolatum TaxID=490979 RepID=A0ABW0S9Q6_9RHOB|nr:hypothetical protein [Rubellimicrobium aerolatum]MBP1805043.1 hypothetical protein [Rubellimicrobium aerolatum]